MHEEEIMTECCSCGQEKMCTFSRDPYRYEVLDESEYDWWCEECLDARRFDI